MVVKSYKKGDEFKILELFELVFKQKLSIENWKWRFRDNPAGKHFIKLMWDNDLLVGHYAVSPTIMQVDGQDVLTALSLTTMTHPDYTGKRIFKTLSKSLYDELEQNHACKAIWGFPNNNSHYGFVKHLGWSNLALMHTLGLNAKKIKPKGLKFQAQEIQHFDEAHSKFINDKINASVYVKRDETYLNWRFIDKPNTNYYCYEFNSEFDKAILIFKFYPIGNDIYDLNIVDSYMDNHENIQDYIAYIIDKTTKKVNRISLWKNLFDKNHLTLEKIGFTPVLPQTYITSRIQQSMPKSFLNFKNWHVSMSDSDVF